MGNKLLDQKGIFNAAVYDEITVVTAEGLAEKRLPQANVYRKQYEKLLKDVIFINATKTNTSDEQNAILFL